MDPFRDELAAAHAKIAQLEERIRHLEKALHERYQRQAVPNVQLPSPSPSTLVVLFAAFAIMAGATGLLFVKFFFAANSRAMPASSASFNGIATAEPPQTANAIPPTVDPRPLASSSAKPKSPAPCNCTPGDPLCSCL